MAKEQEPLGEIWAVFQQQVKVKSLENAEKNPKAIDSWIESISELHRCKPPASVHYARWATCPRPSGRRCFWLCAEPPPCSVPMRLVPWQLGRLS